MNGLPSFFQLDKLESLKTYYALSFFKLLKIFDKLYQFMIFFFQFSKFVCLNRCSTNIIFNYFNGNAD